MVRPAIYLLGGGASTSLLSTNTRPFSALVPQTVVWFAFMTSCLLPREGLHFQSEVYTHKKEFLLGQQILSCIS